MPDKDEIVAYFKALQDDICGQLELTDGGSLFSQEDWTRAEGGGGRSRSIQNGQVFEKGGVNFSSVSGELPEKLKNSFQVIEEDFFATGISLVLHPVNPLVPIVHMNLRYFEMGETHRWFGGGIDLTPHYIIEEDAAFFHSRLKAVCDRHQPTYYTDFKKWADDYFYIPHRKETRGIGGIFFDRLKKTENSSMNELFSFVKDTGNSFTSIYLPLVEKNKNSPYTETEKEWQLHRRSRYVEFNLVYDSGTKFGLETNGRIESILMSLPPLASWKTDVSPQEGSQEAFTSSRLKKGINWAG